MFHNGSLLSVFQCGGVPLLDLEVALNVIRPRPFTFLPSLSNFFLSPLCLLSLLLERCPLLRRLLSRSFFESARNKNLFVTSGISSGSISVTCARGCSFTSSSASSSSVPEPLALL